MKNHSEDPKNDPENDEKFFDGKMRVRKKSSILATLQWMSERPLKCGAQNASLKMRGSNGGALNAAL